MTHGRPGPPIPGLRAAQAARGPTTSRDSIRGKTAPGKILAPDLADRPDSAITGLGERQTGRGLMTVRDSTREMTGHDKILGLDRADRRASEITGPGRTAIHGTTGHLALAITGPAVRQTAPGPTTAHDLIHAMTGRAKTAIRGRTDRHASEITVPVVALTGRGPTTGRASIPAMTGPDKILGLAPADRLGSAITAPGRMAIHGTTGHRALTITDLAQTAHGPTTGRDSIRGMTSRDRTSGQDRAGRQGKTIPGPGRHKTGSSRKARRSLATTRLLMCPKS